MSEARCAVHPDAVATETCARCGDFACAACLAKSGPRKVCEKCFQRGGAALWPAGRALNARAVFAHAISRIPSHGVHALAMMCSFLPSQIAGVVLLKAQAAGGATPATPFGTMSPGGFAAVMAASAFGLVAMLAAWPFVTGSVSAGYADELAGRARRGLWAGGRDLFLRALVLGLIMVGVSLPIFCLFGMALVAYVLSVGPQGIQPTPGAPPPMGFQIVTILVSSVVMTPLFSIWHLAVASAASEDTQIGDSLKAALRFVKTKRMTWAGLVGFQMGLTMIGAVPGSVMQHLIRSNPWIAEPYAVITALIGAVFLVFYPLVYTSFYMARADSSPAT